MERFYGFYGFYGFYDFTDFTDFTDQKRLESTSVYLLFIGLHSEQNILMSTFSKCVHCTGQGPTLNDRNTVW